MMGFLFFLYAGIEMELFLRNLHKLRSRLNLAPIQIPIAQIPTLKVEFPTSEPSQVDHSAVFQDMESIFKNLKQVDPNDDASRYIVNAAILFIYRDQAILVQEPKGKWMLPGGQRNRPETPWEAAVREFNEETGFYLDTKQLLFAKYFDYRGTNRLKPPHTRIFVVGSRQPFGVYNPATIENQETVDLKYVSVHDLLAGLYDAELRNSNKFSLRFLRKLL